MTGTASFDERLTAQGIGSLWSVMAALVKPEPTRTCRPCAWDWETVRPLLAEAAETVPPELAERRVLMRLNPDLPGAASMTRSLYAGLQIVRPGELAPPHRHSQAALRFCLDSDGAYTIMDDRRVDVRPFDLVLTPPFCWHEHGNHGAGAAVWLDGLDIRVVCFFAAEFAEHGPGVSANARPDARSATMARALRALDADGRPAARGRGDGVVCHRYADWRPALAAALEADGGDTAVVEMADPASGGPALRTLAAFARLVRAGATVAPPRSTESQVIVAVEGAGALHVDDMAGAMAPRSVIVASPWSRLRIEAAAETVLLAFSDRAAQQAPGFRRLEGDMA